MVSDSRFFREVPSVWNQYMESPMRGINQNVNSWPSLFMASLTAKDFMSPMVCNRCELGPDSTFLKNTSIPFSERRARDGDAVTFNLQTMGPCWSRPQPLHMHLDEDFATIVTMWIDSITDHHFVAKSQAAFFTSCKVLGSDTILILLDSAENCPFLVHVVCRGIMGQHPSNTASSNYPHECRWKDNGSVSALSLFLSTHSGKHTMLR